MKKKNTLAKIFLGTALGLHMGNQYIRYKTRQNEFLREDEGAFFYSKLGKIFYTKKGKGSPILLIHQLSPFASGYEWTEVIDKLSRKHTVYTIDLLGCGRSEKPGIIYTNFLYVTLILDFINHVIRQSVPIAASRESGAVALMAKKYSPQWISKILIINPMSLQALKTGPDKRSRRFGKLYSLPLLGETLYNIYCSKNAINSVLEDTNRQKAAYDSSHRDASRGRFLYSSIFSRFTRISIDRALIEAGNYAAVLSGEDFMWNEEILQEYKHVSDSLVSFGIIKNCRTPHIEQPEETVKIIEKYLF